MNDDEFDKLVGANVRVYRIARGMTQADLAATLSADGEHVHQQTILKIEKGMRPLKHSEALRMCRALKIGIAQLSDNAEAVEASAAYIERSAHLSEMQTELVDFAVRLAPLLADLATLIALNRDEGAETQASESFVDNAKSWLNQDWGEVLNEFIFNSLRAHPDLTQLRPDLDGVTYSQVLKNASERRFEDASEA